MTRKMIRKPTHPGEALAKDVFPAWGLDIKSAAAKLGLDETYLSAVLREEAPVTKAMGDSLSKEFNNSSQFWLNLQKSHDDFIASQRKSPPRTPKR